MTYDKKEFNVKRFHLNNRSVVMLLVLVALVFMMAEVSWSQPVADIESAIVEVSEQAPAEFLSLFLFHQI